MEGLADGVADEANISIGMKGKEAERHLLVPGEELLDEMDCIHQYSAD